MNKPTPRIHRNGGTKAHSPQPKIVRPPAALPVRLGKSIPEELRLPKGAHGSCLVTFDRQVQEPVSKIPLTEEEFFSILAKHHGNAGEFIATAIRKALAATPFDDLTELEMTISKVNGLLQLLADKFEHLARLDGNDFHGPEANNFCGAVSLLVADAQKQLHDCFDKIFHAVVGPAQEVAS